MRTLLAAVVGLLCLTAAPAAAVEAPPFDPDQRVYVVPDTYTFASRTVLGAAESTEREIHVVVFEQVIDGTIEDGHESETEDAVEAVWAAWRPHEDFDAQESCVVVLAMDDREVRILAGSRWDAELGLHNEALGVIIDQHFIPKAAANDMDGALADLILGLDEEIGRRLAAHLEEAAETARQVAAEQRRAEQYRTLYTVLGLIKPAAKALLLLLIFVGIVALRQRYVRKARNLAQEVFAERLQRLDRAEETVADFRLDRELRDRIVELKLKGEHTRKLFDEVTTEVDEIAVGIEALRGRAEECKGRSDSAFVLSIQAHKDAMWALDKVIKVDTGEVQHKLFDERTRKISVQPTEFMNQLEQRYSQAREGWQRLLDAAEASLRRAEQDFPTHGLDELRETVATAGLNDGWLADHPLFDDPATAWDELDELRRSDPVAYLARLTWSLDAEEDLEEEIDGVIEDIERARKAYGHVRDLDLGGLDTVYGSDAYDPVAAREVADSAMQDLARAAAAAEDADAVDELASRVVVACEAVGSRRQFAAEAVTRAPGRLEEARAAVEALPGRLDTAKTRATALIADHAASSLEDAWREVAEAAQAVAEAQAALARAEACLAARDHVGAVLACGEAIQERGCAVTNLEEIVAVVDQLTADRAEFQRLAATVGAERSRCAQALAHLAPFGSPADLTPGDDLLAALRASGPKGGPADWSQRLDQLKAVIASWSSAATHAKAERARQDRLIREEASDLADWRRASRTDYTDPRDRSPFRSQRKKSFGYSSSSRRSSFGSSSFGRKSSRSGGRSFGSRKRSGGRRMGSRRKRSGGRKF